MNRFDNVTPAMQHKIFGRIIGDALFREYIENRAEQDSDGDDRDTNTNTESESD